VRAQAGPVLAQAATLDALEIRHLYRDEPSWPHPTAQRLKEGLAVGNVLQNMEGADHVVASLGKAGLLEVGDHDIKSPAPCHLRSGALGLHALGLPAALAGDHHHLPGTRPDVEQRAAAEAGRTLDEAKATARDANQVALEERVSYVQPELPDLSEHVAVGVDLGGIGVLVGGHGLADRAAAQLIVVAEVEAHEVPRPTGRTGR
jgi:hypothetical protein